MIYVYTYTYTCVYIYIYVYIHPYVYLYVDLCTFLESDPQNTTHPKPKLKGGSCASDGSQAVIRGWATSH